MGFKLKNLGTSYRGFAANIGPLNLTAGVPVAEIYMGMHGRLTLAAGAGLTLATCLDEIDEVTITRRGETIVSIENGQDLFALELAPWFDHNIKYTTGASSSHYFYVKGLALPCNYPVGVSGEFQLTVENAANANTATEVMSIAEGQGFYRANEFGMGEDLLSKHFHIVKRLFTPAGTGWNSGLDIGTEGDLVGILVWSTTEEGKTVAKTSMSLYEVKLEIGGETVLQCDPLTLPCREGARTSGQSSATFQTEQIAEGAILDQYFYIDFARQPWDCRGKTVVFSTNAGTADAIRVYPIYLVDA